MNRLIDLNIVISFIEFVLVSSKESVPLKEHISSDTEWWKVLKVSQHAPMLNP